MFATEDQTQRARLFHQVTTGTMAVATVLLFVLLWVQPAQTVRAISGIAAVNILGIVLLAMNRAGRTRAASIGLVAGLVALVTVMSLSGGGIRSPGVTMFFVFVLTAGLLLGQRAGVIAASVCAAIGLALALVDPWMPPPAVPYRPLALWLLNCIYMGVVLILLRLATDAMAKALGRAESEIVVRKRAEGERERLLRELGERVKELQLLHSAARLLQGTRPFDRSVLVQLVGMMPQAWLHPQQCEARIAYRDMDVCTSGWRKTPWRLSSGFATTDGVGAVEVIYREEQPAADDGPFLVEERALIDSLAEMLAAYLEHDIAERERVELERQLRQSQQMEALGTLAGGIAHDFNNLLTAIGGNAELALRESSSQAAVKEHLAEIQKAHGRARDLVQRILLFSRRQESHRKAIELAPVLEEALKLLRASLPAAIDIRFHADPGLPAVMADASQMHQVFINLGTNAGHAMSGYGGVLEVVLDRVTIADAAASRPAGLHSGPHLRIQVRDTGTGISPDILPHLFEPFFTTKGPAGTGLGLSVVHGIVSDHGGAITVTSEQGHGSVFAVYLPAASSDATPEVTAPVEIAHGRGQHIMYVDDEEALVFVMKRLVEHLGYRCTAFTEAPAALEAFRANPAEYAAVVTDMAMPAMSGLRLVGALRDMRPDLPVAIASGYEGTDVAAADRSGILRIPKPVSVHTLSQALKELLG